MKRVKSHEFETELDADQLCDALYELQNMETPIMAAKDGDKVWESMFEFMRIFL